MKYLDLLSTISIPYYSKEKLTFITALLGILLGIALYSSVRLANESAIESFHRSVTRISGPDTIRLEKTSAKIPEAAYLDLLSMPEIETSSPMSSRFVPMIESGAPVGKIQINGIDIFSGISSVLKDNKIPRETILSLLSLPYSAILLTDTQETPDHLTSLTILADGMPVDLDITAVIQNPESGIHTQGNSLIVDISVFQEMFDEYGVVDAFIITPSDRSDSTSLAEHLRGHFGDTFRIQTGSSLSEGAKEMSAAFRLNLLFLSGIAVLLAVLLIYNLSSFHILKRRKDLGILLSLGATPGTLFTLLMLEAASIGITSAVPGILLGYLFSYVSIDLVSKTFSTLYYPVENTTMSISPSLVLECIAIGLTASLAGALLPALEAFRIPVKDTFGYQSYEQKFYALIPGLTIASLSCLLCAFILSRFDLLDYSIYFGFIVPILLLFGSILLCPAFILICLKGTRRISEKMHILPILLASDHISQTLRRYSIALASIVVAISMGLGLSIMTGSFRSSVETWITKVTQADLYISSAIDLQSTSDTSLPEELVSFLASNPSVRKIDWVMSEAVTIDAKTVKVLGNRFDILENNPRLFLINSDPHVHTSSELFTNDSAFISESLAIRHGLIPGAHITVPGIHTEVKVLVRGIFKDFSTEQGVLIISDKNFRELFLHTKKEAVSAYLSDGASTDMLIHEINAAFPGHFFKIRNNQELRSEVLAIFDQTFLITRGIRGMIAVLALFILAMCIRMLLLERKREFSILHAIGANRKIIAYSVISESMLIGTFSIIAGLFFGIILSLYLVYNINTHFFGWTLEYALHWSELMYATGITVACAFLAGILPLSSSALSFKPGDLRYE
jgi:putative ABC transport system permease protein